MDAAKSAINKLTAGHGHHTTEVTEHYKPAVTHEQVNSTREHVDTTVVDKEHHHEHHHTSVLPVQHKEVLPTEHSHNIASTKHTEHNHGDHQSIRNKVAAEAAQFKDHTETAPTEKIHTVAPTIAGEHHHHHVHETIQPIIQKQTIQPSVVHTTIPVHEVHHNEPKHYTASALPAVSLDEFQKQGGSLSGLADRTERFEGEPENIAQRGLHSGSSTSHTSGGLTGSNTTDSGINSRVEGSDHHGHHGHHGTSTGTSGLGSSTTGTSGLTGSHNTGTGLTGSHNTGSGIDSRVDRTGHHDTTGTGIGQGYNSKHGDHLSNTTSHSSTETGKPSLLQKLNPFKDTDGDGKKGVME